MIHSSVSRLSEPFWAIAHATALAAVIDGSVKSSSRAAAAVRIEGLHCVARCSSPDQHAEGSLSSPMMCLACEESAGSAIVPAPVVLALPAAALPIGSPGVIPVGMSVRYAADKFSAVAR